jgi:hypothetical protein
MNRLTGLIPSELGSLTRLETLDLCKFATISSSELDTIILLESFLQFISSTVFVDINQFTGPIPSELGSLTNLQYLALRKFATTSSSELDTIILLGPCLQFISSTVFVDVNQLTGNLDPLFCNVTDAFSDLAADCWGSDADVVCSCCDICF